MLIFPRGRAAFIGTNAELGGVESTNSARYTTVYADGGVLSLCFVTPKICQCLTNLPLPVGTAPRMAECASKFGDQKIMPMRLTA